MYWLKFVKGQICTRASNCLGCALLLLVGKHCAHFGKWKEWQAFKCYLQCFWESVTFKIGLIILVRE